MADPYRILVVCTANICRSVMAERFLRRDGEARGLDHVEISSCGFRFDDQPASEMVLAVLGERELDASDHRSRKFSPEVLANADLVVAMERSHVRDLAVAVEGASPRIHTLGAVVEWLRTEVPVAGSPADRVAAFAEGRRSADVLGSGPDEIEDPHGRSKRVHRKSADRIEDLCSGLLDGLFGTTVRD